jgi:hypothetical protein
VDDWAIVTESSKDNHAAALKAASRKGREELWSFVVFNDWSDRRGHIAGWLYCTLSGHYSTVANQKHLSDSDASS